MSGLSAENLPELDDPAAVRYGAAGLLSSVMSIENLAGEIGSTWAGLAASYEAPESGQVLQAMDKPVSIATTAVTNATTARDALFDYADRLGQLRAERDALAADITAFYVDKAEKQESNWDGFAGWRDWSGQEDAELLAKEEALAGRIQQLQEDAYLAELACANAIRGVWSDVTYSLADRTSVHDEHVYGMSAEGLESLTQSGDAPWGRPSMWTEADHPLVTGYMTARGAYRSVAGMVEMGWDLSGWGGDQGATEFARSGTMRALDDLATVFSTPLLIHSARTDPAGTAESWERVVGMGKSMIGWDTWDSDPYGTGGGLALDVAGIFLGGAGAAKAGLRGMMRISPNLSLRVTDLSTALRTGIRTGYVDALTGLRNLSYDLTDATRAATSATRAGMDTVTTGVRGGYDHLVAGLRGGGPQPAPAGVPGGALDLPTASAGRGTGGEALLHRTDTSTAAPDRPGTAGAAPTTTTPRLTSDGRKVPGWFTGDHADLNSQAATSTRRYQGDAFDADLADDPDAEPAATIRGEPPAATRVDWVGGRGQRPLAAEAFGSPEHLARTGMSLEANTKYHVRGRGTFYTDPHGKVVFAEIAHGARMSSDLRHPGPDMTYFVDDYAYFATDRAGRTSHIHIEDVELRPETPRSRAAQRSIAGGADGYDAGHGLARLFGGTREEINLVRMIRELNQGQAGNVRTFRAIEHTLEAALKDTTGRSGISFDLRIGYPDAALTHSTEAWSVPPQEYRFTLLQGQVPLTHTDGRSVRNLLVTNGSVVTS